MVGLCCRSVGCSKKPPRTMMPPRVTFVSRVLLATIVWTLLTDRWGGCATGAFPPLGAFEMDGAQRKTLLLEAVAVHSKGELQEAATAYSRLLEVIPNDPDGLHLLGLVRHGQGKLLREASKEKPDENKSTNAPSQADPRQGDKLFAESERLVRSAISSAANEMDALQMRCNLGEVLRTKGDLKGAVLVLRGVLAADTVNEEVRRQGSFNLAVTLVDIVRRSDRSPRIAPPAEGVKEVSEKNTGPEEEGGKSLDGRPRLVPDEDFGRAGWAVREEAEALLREHISIRPDDKDTAWLELAALLKSNWDFDRAGGGSASNLSGEGSGPGQRDWGEEVLSCVERAVLLDPSNAEFALERAATLHRLGRTEEAREGYFKVLTMEEAGRGVFRGFALSNLAALKQEMGDAEGAVEGYREILTDSPPSAVVLNNLGAALMALGQYSEGGQMLEQALLLDPLNLDVMLNLGVYCQEEGNLDRARSLYDRAQRLRRNDGLAVRKAIMLPPIMTTEQAVLAEKDRLSRAVDELIAREPPLSIPDPGRGVERVHFYLVYRGGNHRALQEKIARMYTLATLGLLSVSPELEVKNGEANSEPHVTLPHVALPQVTLPHERLPKEGDGASRAAKVSTPGGNMLILETVHAINTVTDGNKNEIPTETPASTGGVASVAMGRTGGTFPGTFQIESTSTDDVPSAQQPLRVGFASKFFGEQEPHGMLLEGIIKYLPRKYFRVVVCPITSPGRRLSRPLTDTADEIVQLPMKQRSAREILGSLRLDILIYADMNSEPTTHFLGYARLARVQAVFWGNPITTGNPSIDYFISSEVMEDQNRTLLFDKDEPYTEQVVLLSGQGIWYERPLHAPWLSSSEKEATKARLRRQLKSTLGIEQDSVVYMCPQSLFKLRPAFDLMLRDILRSFGNQESGKNAYLVLTEGRRKLWTEAVLDRLKISVPEILSQVKMVPRTSAGEEFHTLLASADVILHPFPFGGSKTAADGLSLGVPVVAMEGDALPGRMAFSFYKTMGLEGPNGCCVAGDRDSYVTLAVRLGRDAKYRRWAGHVIDQRSPALWERRDVVLEWARFLARAGGRSPPTALEVGRLIETDTPLSPPEPFQSLQEPFEDPAQDTLHCPPPPPPPPPQNLFREPFSGPVQSSSSQKAFQGTIREPAQRKTIERERSPLDGGKMTSEPPHNIVSSHHGPHDDLRLLLERFSALHGDGRLDQAAENLERALTLMGELRSTRENVTRGSDVANDDDGSKQGSSDSLSLSQDGLNSARKASGTSVSTRSAIRSTVDGVDSGVRHSVPDRNEFSSSSIDAADNNSPLRAIEALGDEFASREDEIVVKEGDEAGKGRGRLPDIAGVMNDLGCTYQQLWRLDEAEAMLRGAIKIRPLYASAMTNLGVTLQANDKIEEAELWHREALRLSSREGRDACLCNLTLLMRAGGGRLEEAADLIAREIALPELNGGGITVAVLSLLEPRPLHEQAFRELQERAADGGGGHTENGTLSWWEEASRLREWYLASTNNLVVFLGLLGRLGDIVHVLQEVSGMELPFSLHDERALLPPELQTPAHSLETLPGLGSPASQSSSSLGRLRLETQAQDVVKNLSSAREGEVEGEQRAHGRHRYRRRPTEYDRHFVHVVTQYYVPADARRAREIDFCLMRNLRNPLVGTVHLLTDHPEAKSTASKEAGGTPSLSDTEWQWTEWRPRALRDLGPEFIGKARVVALRKRMTFQDAIRYSNDLLNGHVVLISNSDIFFGASLARLGDPSTLAMKSKVFALAKWQTDLLVEHPEDEYVINTTSITARQYGSAAASSHKEPDFLPRIDSQDAWIFRSPLPTSVVQETGFEMGRPRCDGRLARVLMDAGYSVTNPSLSIVAHHVHNAERSSEDAKAGGDQHSRNYRGDVQVPGDTAFLPISDQWLF